MTPYNVAHFNAAQLKGAPEDLPGFMEEIDRQHALADAAPGFVWRHTTTGDNSLDSRVSFGGYHNLIVNLSVWTSIEALWQFSYAGPHVEALRRRREWFVRVPDNNVLWWIAAGERPTVPDAVSRMLHLWTHGPTRHAFTFKQRFDAQATEEEAALLQALQAPQDGAGSRDEAP